MRSVTNFFILVIFYIVTIREVLLDCHPTYALMERYDGLTEEFLIWKGFVESKMACSMKCYYEFRCLTFQYNPDTNCRVHATDIDTLKNRTTSTTIGYVTYQMQGRMAFGEECTTDEECHFPNSECRQSSCGCITGYSFNPMKHTCTSGLHGDECTMDEECYLPNTECRQSTCGCIVGYSFNPINGTCTHGCEEYGNTYGIFTGLAVMGHDLQSGPVSSLQECKDVCSSLSECKTFDYQTSGSWCYPKDTGALDEPSDLTHSDSNIHGVRNCNN